MEVVLEALDVSLEVELSLRVVGGSHLREINDGNVLIIVYKQVELVEVTMDEAEFSQSDDLVQKVRVHFLRVHHLLDLRHRMSSDEGHHDAMSIGVYRDWGWEVTFVQGFHEGKFLE